MNRNEQIEQLYHPKETETGKPPGKEINLPSKHKVLKSKTLVRNTKPRYTGPQNLYSSNSKINTGCGQQINSTHTLLHNFLQFLFLISKTYVPYNFSYKLLSLSYAFSDTF